MVREIPIPTPKTKESLKESLEKESVFPEKVEDIKTSDYLGGSSGVKAGFYKGEIFVLKKARKLKPVESEPNLDQIKEEYIAEQIYKAMGFAVPESKIYDAGLHKVSKFVEGKDLRVFGGAADAGDKESLAKYEEIKKQIKKGYVLDALLANWDVIGQDEDNIRLSDDGKVYRMDNGGALRFRARGGAKGADFKREVLELETLKARNEIFSDITDEEIEKQIKDIIDSEEIILKTVESAAQEASLSEKSLEELKFLLKQRIDYLISYLIELKKRKEKKLKEDKGIYESAITKRYFEDWDSLELEGNPGLKDQIRENIIRAEKANTEYYIRMARDLGISVEEFKERLQAKVEEMVRRAEFFRATQVNVLDKVFNVDGRWKSQFETNDSGGTLNPKFRAIEEAKMFCFNKAEIPEEDLAKGGRYEVHISNEVLEKDKEKRPIYGYFSDEEHGAINSHGRIPPPTNVHQYGTVNIKIKKDRAFKKATLTFQDSLGRRGWPPTPVAKPHFTSFRVEYLSGQSFMGLRGPSVTNWGENYTEVQFHGQLTLDDVESVYISPNNFTYYEPEGVKSELQRVHQVFDKYKTQHPESDIKLIEF